MYKYKQNREQDNPKSSKYKAFAMANPVVAILQPVEQRANHKKITMIVLHES